MKHLDYQFMTDREREIYKLRQETGKTFTAIAKDLNIGVSAVTSHYRSAERRIREFERYKQTQGFDTSEKHTIRLSTAELKVITFAISVMRSYDVQRILEKEYKVQNKRYNHLTYINELACKLQGRVDNLIKKSVRKRTTNEADNQE